MLRHRFDSLARVPQIEAPLLCLVATEDRVIPVARSRALFEAWRGAKTWHEVPRSDHGQHRRDPGYWRSIADFLKALALGDANAPVIMIGASTNFRRFPHGNDRGLTRTISSRS